MAADAIQSDVDDIKANLMTHMASSLLKCPSIRRQLKVSHVFEIFDRRRLAATVVGLSGGNDTVTNNTCSSCKVVSGSFIANTQDGGAADVCGLSLQAAAYLKTLQGVTFQGSDQCSGLSYAGASKADSTALNQKTIGPVVIAVVAFVAFAILFSIVFKRRRKNQDQKNSINYDTESEPDSPNGPPSPVGKKYTSQPPRVLDLQSRNTEDTPSTLRTLESV